MGDEPLIACSAAADVDSPLYQAFVEGVRHAQFGRASLLLDRRGTVALVTAAASRILDNDGSLFLRESRLHATSDADAIAVDALIAGLIAENAAPRALQLTDRTAGPRILVGRPFHLPNCTMPHAPAAFLTIITPDAPGAPELTLYRQAFGLTKREAEIAGLIMLGNSIESASALLGMQLATARIHLRNLFRKTGALRQAELVRLLSLLS